MKKILLVTIFALSMASALSITCRAHGVQAPAEPQVLQSVTHGAEAVLSSSPNGVNEPVEAENAEDLSEYVISKNDAGYVLFRIGDTEPETVAEGTLEVLLSFLGGKRVRFDEITAEGDIVLPEGEIFISGKIFTPFSLKVKDGTSLVLDGAEITFNGGGSFIVDGGEVSVCNAHLFSSLSSAVRLEGGILALHTGCIQSSSDYAAITALGGSLEIFGGEIISERSEAIRAASSVLLSGAPKIVGVGCDLISKTALTLGNGGIPYTPAAPLKLRWEGSFGAGTLTPISHIDAQTSGSSLRVFDEVGKEYTTTYFADYPGVSERAFVAVYLPYSVKYYGGGTNIATHYALLGEKINPPEAEVKKGYAFDGWYLDSAARVPLTPDFKVSGDIKLYAKYRLLPPEFMISSFSGEYTARRTEIGFDTLAHPLDAYGGRYEYKWYKDGTLVSEGKTLSVKDVSDSGVYSCTVTYYYSADSVSVRAEGISVVINKRCVPIPSIAPKVYNGRAQSPDLYFSSLYTASEVTGVDAGVYSVTLTLLDEENYRFEGGEGIVTVPFEILKANNVWTEEITVFDIYIGAEADVRARSLFGEVVYLYSESVGGEYSPSFPSGVGEYFVRAFVPADRNYNEIISEPLKFSVLEERATSLSVITLPGVTAYRAFEHVSLSGISVRVKYNSGREDTVDGSKLSVSYQQGDSFRYGDSAAVVSYMGASVAIPVSVSRASYDVSPVVLTELTKTYNAAYQSAKYEGKEILGEDGVPLKTSVSGGGVDVGEYVITLSFFTDSDNYETPASITSKLIILPYIAEITWQNTSFVYDGSSKVPTASYVDCGGIVRYPKVLGAEVMAGDTYTAYAISDNPNYSFVSDSTSYRIFKADYDLSGLYWISEDFVYDGTEKRVSLSGLPSGVFVTGYTDAAATDSGKYTATASVSFDERNYNAPDIQTHRWQIFPAKYDMTGVTFNNVSAVFDGKAHYPELVGTMPTGEDGITLEYSFSRGATHVYEGTVTVAVSFFTKSKNYIAPDIINATATVTPRGISVAWAGDNFVYKGEPIAPVASAPECKILVSGAMTDAGEYTATAYTENSDYFVINSELPFKILKADNAWISPPSAKDVYESGTLNVLGTAKSGEASFSYFTDPECKNECTTPSAPGIYYAVAYAEESRNYFAIRSLPIRFEIIKVMPSSLSVALTKSAYTACSSIGDADMLVRLIYNDGSEQLLCAADIQIIYQDSGELRARHTQISFKYGNFGVTLPITVNPADYDTSSVLWQNTLFYYDGLAKQPTLTGLPSGISVLGYTTADATRAGVYSTEAILSYDKENYNPPTIPPCTFEIKKACVNIPATQTLEYDGKPHAPMTSSPLYRFLSEGAYISAGRYSFIARLTDSDNYVFEDGSSECSLIYEISPRKISISVSDTNVYLFDAISDADYAIYEGNIIDGDELSLVQYEEDGKIYLRTDNPNYSLKLVPGRINNLPYPSPEMSAKIIIGVIVFIAVVLFAFVVFLERERIADFFAIAKFRIKSYRKKHRHTSRPERAGSALEIFRPQIFDNDRCGEIIRDKSSVNDKKDGETDGISDSTDNCTQDGTTLADEDETQEWDTDFTDRKYCDEASFESDGVKADVDSTNVEIYFDNADEKNCFEDGTQLSCFFSGDTECGVSSINTERADELISDSLAKDLLKKKREVVYTDGDSKSIVNVDTLSQSFRPGDRVDVNILKEKSLVPYDTAYLKVLARGAIDKPLSVYANDFSLSAVKMIALTGGEAIRVVTLKSGSQRDRKK